MNTNSSDGARVFGRAAAFAWPAAREARRAARGWNTTPRSRASNSALALLASFGLASLATAGWQGGQNGSFPSQGASLESVAVAAGDLFGASLSISAGRAFIGAPGDDGGGTDAGAAYVFERDATGWRFVQKISAPDAQPADGFGSTVALDGDWALVGAPGVDAGASGAGAAYAYHWDGVSWQLQATLEAPLAVFGAQFGYSVALGGGPDSTASHSAGARAFLGAPGDAGGAVHEFALAESGWVYVARLRANDSVEGDSFGVGLDFDGTTLVVGAHGAASSGAWSGAAYVFVEREGSLHEAARLSAPDATASLFFGVDVAVDGELIAVGARGDAQGGFWSGAVYVFGGSGTQWNLERKLKSDVVLSGAHFGSAVALAGETLLVGARWDPTQFDNAGAAYLFHRGVGDWPQDARFLRAGAWVNDWFGSALDIDRGEVLIGAPRSDAPEQDSGSASGWRVAPGESFCAGDGTSFPCSCANLGATGCGCANSAGPGALLQADGTASLGARDLRWLVSELPPAQPALLFAASAAQAQGFGTPFGDGLRCLEGLPTRLRAGLAGEGGALQFSLEALDKGQFTAGETIYFQVWYRDTGGGPCSTGFNTTNGYVVNFDA